MRNIVLLCIVCAGFLFGSCSSSRHIGKSSSAGQVSEKLGFPVSKKDRQLPLYTEAVHWLGVPYKYGGNTSKGVDCSGLVCNMAGMYKKNCRKISRNALRPGDLVFFNTAKTKKSISHVGIFLKGNTFIHATTHSGVRLSTLDETYYKKRWISGGKVKK